MSYEMPDIREYVWGETNNWAAATALHYIQGPKGKVGFVRDLLVEVTTSMVGTTSVPELMVGISSADFTYGRYRLGTALTTGYAVGVFDASDEPDIVGNPPRTGTAFASHVVLDGGPLTSAGVAGGTYLTVVPQGRIPASGMVITNVINGTGNVPRIFLRDPIPPQLVTGQLINVVGVQGATGTNGVQLVISAISAANQYIETSGTFGGTYSGGGVVNIVVVVTLKANGAASGGGGGVPHVTVQWIGANTP